MNLKQFIKEQVQQALKELKFNPQTLSQIYSGDPDPSAKLSYDDGGQEHDVYKKMRKAVEAAKLRRISEGSSRAAYVLDSKRVLKLAVNKKGIKQNEAEVKYGTDEDIKPLVATVWSHDPNYAWIVSDLVRPLQMDPYANSEDSTKYHDEFQQLTGVSWGQFQMLLRRINTYIPKYGMKTLLNALENSLGSMKEARKLLNTPVIKTIIKVFKSGKFDSPVADLTRLDHWGKTADGRVVLLDYGLTSDILNKFY